MRAFNDFEKGILKRAIEIDLKVGSLNTLANLLEHSVGNNHIPNFCYISIISPENVNIQLDQDVINNLPDYEQLELLKKIDNDITQILMSIITLFEYLSEQRLAYFTGDIDIPNLGIVVEGSNYTQCDFLDKDTKKLVYKYARKKIYISETLKVMAVNDFKSTEDMKLEHDISSTKTQLKYTQYGLGVTFCGLLASILIPVFYTGRVELANKVIDVNVNTSLVKSIMQIETEISKLNLLLNRKYKTTQ